MKTRGMSHVWLLIVVLLVIWAGILYVHNKRGSFGPVNTEGWVTFTSERYGFSIKHPADWNVEAFPDDELAPRFNIFPPTVLAKPPFTHHDNVANVSVFPHGVPTEGIMGETATSSVEFGEELQHAIDYVLDDGEPWATFAGFADPPVPWQSWGFVFARVPIENLDVTCVRGALILTEEACDPFEFGDVITRAGSVDETLRAIEVAILESFEFTHGVPSHPLIRVTEPAPNAPVQSPLTVKGEARGTWFFEASFPFELRASDGSLLKQHYAEAQDEWMTENFVPFIGALEFDVPNGITEGTLIFRKDNPSGLPEHDDSFSFPVRFGAPQEGSAAGGCIISGCSAQICSDEEVITTCEYRSEYACYANAVCERQGNGQCGWTENAELKQCLVRASDS